MALQLDMVDDLLVQHDTSVLGGQWLKPGEVAPEPLAVICLRASRPRMFGTPIEVAQMRVRTQFSDLMEPESPDATKKLLFAVIAVGDHGTEMRQSWLLDHTRQWVEIDVNSACRLFRPLAGGRCLLHTEAIGTVAGDLKPGQG